MVHFWYTNTCTQKLYTKVQNYAELHEAVRAGYFAGEGCVIGYKTGLWLVMC